MIEEELNKAIETASKFTEHSLKVAPEKQDAHLDPMRAYACWFTAFHMYFTYRYPLKFSQTWEEFKKNCVKYGGMTEGFSILDASGSTSRIAKAAGFDLVRRDTTIDICQKIMSLLDLNQPVPFSLNGEHYEMATGYKIVDDRMCFEVKDPGYQNDEYCDALTLEVFHIKDGKRVYSKAHNGGHRKITRAYWFE